MSTATLNRTVGELVVERPARACVFERFGIDYCCGGKKPLIDACIAKSVDPQHVMAGLYTIDADVDEEGTDWSTAPLTSLADHIEATHHAYLKDELPRLDFLTEKVASRHGDHTPSLMKLRQIFVHFKAELESHMAKEEQVLFPIIRKLEQGQVGFHCGSVQNPIRVMVMEHEHAGEAMEQFRELTNDYTPPPEACNTYRALFDSLHQLEQNMHQHVHKENNILFPRAVKLEAGLG